MTASAPFSPEEIEAVRRPFRAASLLPARAYHDQAVWAFERDNWFFRDWICVGREEDALEPGTFFRSARGMASNRPTSTRSLSWEIVA